MSPQRSLAWLVSLGMLVILAASCSAQPEVAVRVDTQVRHQTVLGWGKTTPWLPVAPRLRDLCIERAVKDLGINRLRFEGLCGNGTDRRSWEWLNDNEDPFDINWQGFNTAQLDERASAWLVPWKRAVEARGEPFNLYVSPSFFQGGSSGNLPPWMLADPQEYAEWALALLLRLRDVHGITADYYSICNEAGNNNVFTPDLVARMAKALMPRLRAAGLPTLLQFPESVNAQVAWRYVQALQADAELWQWIGLISYHWYGADNQAAMAQLRQFAVQRGLPTAQTEFMGLTIDHLYDDFVIGGVSYWEIYGLGSPDYKAALSHVSSNVFRGGDWYWRFRQVSHYVRPGAVRVAATSTDPAVRALAFDRQGKVTVVLIHTTKPGEARRVTVAGLPPGTYGICRCVGKSPYEEMGTQTVGADGRLQVPVPPDCVLTVYARNEANLAPIVTEWRSIPDFLTVPASTLELRAAATDPEGDMLAYQWTVLATPVGAQVSLTNPGGASTQAAGLTVPGEYIFEVQVSDGRSAVARRLSLQVFPGNQPPVPVDVHNRIPVWVTVREGYTTLRSGSWDIEDDPVTYRWSLVRAPAGASPVLETPNRPTCKVTGLTVPGDYVFRLAVSDPTHTVALEHSVPVYP